MGIRFFCPRGHKLNVKAELAGKIGICPKCGEKMMIPLVSTREPGEKKTSDQENRMVKSLDVVSDHPVSEGISNEMINSGGSGLLDDLANLQSDYLVESPSVGDDFDPEEKSVGIEQIPSTPISDPLPKDPSSVSSPVLPASPASASVPNTSSQLLSDPAVLWYVRAGDHQSYGPASGAIIQSWIQERRIGPSMLVWREGWSTWLEARNVFPELESIFHANSPDPPAIPSPSSSVISDLPVVDADEPSQTIAEQKKIARKKKAHRDLMIVISLIVVIIVLITLLCFILFKQKNTDHSSAPVLSMSLIFNDCPFSKDHVL